MSPSRCSTLAFLPVHSETVGQWLQPRLHPLVPHSLSTPPTPTKTAQVKDTHDPHVAKSYGHLPSVFYTVDHSLLESYYSLGFSTPCFPNGFPSTSKAAPSHPPPKFFLLCLIFQHWRISRLGPRISSSPVYILFLGDGILSQDF